MPRAFHSGTAEQVVATVEAVVAFSGGATLAQVAEFTDLREDTARAALALAGDLGLVDPSQQNLLVSNPICRLLRTPSDKQKAAVIRIVLESYEPFLVFREELQSSGDVTLAANRTKARLDLAAHREDVKSTILGLATYSGALIAGHGTQYQRDNESFSTLVLELAAGAADQAAAIHEIREQIGNDAANNTSHENVISPLAAALRQAAARSGREAIVNAGNAIETFLIEYAARHAVNLDGANGVNAKLDRLKAADRMPTKLSFNGKYLGHLRNAADHGVDAEIGAPWGIHEATGLNYVLVATAFIRAVRSFETGQHTI